MNNKLIKIVLPLCLLIIIAGIWVFKNTDKVFGNNETYVFNEDFVLEAVTVDLDKLNSYNMPVIIDFGADSCLPCKEMAPVLKALNSEMQGKAIIKFVDVWKNPDAAKDFPVQVIPTQIFINADGKPYVPGDGVSIRFNMYSYADTGEHAFTVHQGGLTEEQMRSILQDMGVD